MEILVGVAGTKTNDLILVPLGIMPNDRSVACVCVQRTASRVPLVFKRLSLKLEVSVHRDRWWTFSVRTRNRTCVGSEAK